MKNTSPRSSPSWRCRAEDAPRYGIAAGPFLEERVFRIEKLVEKPAAADAPSNYAVIGRYILTPDIFPLLKRGNKGAGSEIQLTDAVVELMKKRQVLGYFFEGRRFDAGTTLGYIETLIHVALQREDTREFTRRLLRGLALDEKL